jgi:DnaJ-class molecular chaperone
LKTHYEILGLLNSADDVVIKAAYKALAQKYHPDKHKTNQEMATRLMTELNAAHAILGHKSKRKEYDAWLLSSTKAKTKSKATTASPTSHTPPADYQELIEQLKHNLLDEIVVVELYEKFFACKVKIINGWVNSYAIQSGKKSVHLDFIKLKTRIIEHLEQM